MKSRWCMFTRLGRFVGRVSDIPAYRAAAVGGSIFSFGGVEFAVHEGLAALTIPYRSTGSFTSTRHLTFRRKAIRWCCEWGSDIRSTTLCIRDYRLADGQHRGQFSVPWRFARYEALVAVFAHHRRSRETARFHRCVGRRLCTQSQRERLCTSM